MWYLEEAIGGAGAQRGCIAGYWELDEEQTLVGKIKSDSL